MNLTTHAGANVPRFVILEHTGTPTYKPGRHWDLMLQIEDRLRTWELEALPVDGVAVRSVALPDHRLDYLDYEGPLSQDRGTVRRCDWGVYKPQSQTENHLAISLLGQRLTGRLRLDRDPLDPSLWWASFELRGGS